MSSYNHVTIIGNLVRDPEVKYIPSGTAVCKFSIAVNSKFKSGDEWKEKVCYIDIESWGKTAENMGKYMKKGRSILIDGRLEQERWDDKDGNKRSKHKVVANQVVFLGSGRSDGEQSNGDDEKPIDDEIPF